MKRSGDDFTDWRIQQENLAKLFPYVFPQMPPRLQRCCAFARAVFLIQWGLFGFFALGSMVLLVPILIFQELSVMTEKAPFLVLLAAQLLPSLMISFLAGLLRFTPKLFWRCPCCWCWFPYYVPTRGDNLREKECLLNVKGQHIKYAKLKCCPLIIPSVCPECKMKFFEVVDGVPTRGE